jgi:hypothetical protein
MRNGVLSLSLPVFMAGMEGKGARRPLTSRLGITPLLNTSAMEEVNLSDLPYEALRTIWSNAGKRLPAGSLGFQPSMHCKHAERQSREAPASQTAATHSSVKAKHF